jgi:hypothetical protein
VFNYFNQSGIPDSHFHVAYDGTVEQYVDTSMRAFADLDGNDATVSIETQGVSASTGDEPWRPAQAAAIIKLVAWIMETHNVPRKLATTAFPGSASSQGLSWHRLGCDGNFPALPSIQAGRTQRGGGMRYSTSYGKVCPGYKRVTQIHQEIWPGVQKALGATPTPKPDPEEIDMAAKDEILEALEKHHEGVANILRRVDPQSKEAADKSRWTGSRIGGTYTDESLSDVVERIEATVKGLAAAVEEIRATLAES